MTAVWILAAATLTAFLAGLAEVAIQIRFLAHAYPVQGTVVSDWRYRRYGRLIRLYRVEFHLRNGQQAHLRSAVASSAARPGVGQPVPVLVSERAGHAPKARIDTWPEMWFASAVLIGIGTLGMPAVVFLARSAAA